ncbi:mechanosensitive ion channel [Brumimicrobium glaciale]|jgi:miniconductance mechanosensitive channel|uniref:Mechanosensing system component YbdG n=1 Tax=Brumimicrobium glaciale TaxID=200475 RepID=A0A4Q4KTM7_9FLAO|nr:mechanosensitive ion channel domain-containing protein [Brumimicrobium glaciale]RYM36109.1 mechanosensitive ion channel [Brumimicrobium glaciale]
MKELIFNWIKTFYSIDKSAPIEELLNNSAYKSHEVLWMLALLVGMAVLSILIWFLTKQVLLAIIKTIALRSKTKLDDLLVQKKFFNSIAHILPLVFMDYLFSIVFFSYPKVLEFVIRINDFLIVLVILISIRRFLNAVRVVLEDKPYFSDKPIGAYIQTVKLIISIVFVIILLSVITNQSPLFFLTSLGAMTAILLLVFKDTILGFVGSIQISANDMLRIGDWVTMERYGADGDVIEINLTTVKVQNFDKTITTIPTYSFISDSFKNWRGMSDSGGRRIKRSLNVKIETIKFADDALLARLSKTKLLTAFILEQEEAVEQYNKEHGLMDEYQINARRPTNVGLFRRYVEYYLKNNTDLNQEMSLMVRQLQPDSKGLPIELYCFSNTKVWAEYEVVMADIFDHLFAVVDRFELQVHQEVTGSDLRMLVADKSL